MKTHVLADDTVCLQFGTSEHLALSRSLLYLLINLESCDVLQTLGMNADEAYAFVYSLYVNESLARAEGIDWLPEAELGQLVLNEPPLHLVAITFTPDGAEWRLSLEQLWFIESCASEVAGRAE